MTHTASRGIEELRGAMDGPVIGPGDPDFDDGRRVWNAGIDRRPSLIARCASAADVVEALGLARAHQLEVSVRGGAHNSAGTAVCDDGVMIDLSQLNEVTVRTRVSSRGHRDRTWRGARIRQDGAALPAGSVRERPRPGRRGGCGGGRLASGDHGQTDSQ